MSGGSIDASQILGDPGAIFGRSARLEPQIVQSGAAGMVNTVASHAPTKFWLGMVMALIALRVLMESAKRG